MAMNQEAFKVPNRSKKGQGGVRQASATSRKLQLPSLPADRPITRGSMKAWQEGTSKPWSDLPGLKLKFTESTSDYGTASEKSGQSLVSSVSASTSPHESCNCENMSGIGVVSSDDDDGICVDDLKNSLEMCQWDSEEDNNSKGDWESADEVPSTARVLKDPQSRVTAIIPASSARKLQNAQLVILSDPKYIPKLSKMERLCSPIISLGPHGMHFEERYQVYLSIPVCVHDENLIVCLRSNTAENEEPKWERLPKTCYRYKDGFIIMIVNHFSLFTVILEEPHPERQKRIRKRNGGSLFIEDIPGVEVTFPRGCLEDDIDAYLRVIFDTDTALLPDNLKRRYSLASPIIMIGPHGLEFPPDRPLVTINLPVPDLQEICNYFKIKDPLKSLAVWQSPTSEMEPVNWSRLRTDIVLNLKHPSGMPVVTFKVQHFSFFTVFWDIVSSSLTEAKIGMAHFANFVTFSMMCEAFMQETPNTNRFGLEVICYRSDRKLPDTSNLQHRVGACNKPKLMRPGKILVRLRSQMFEADTEAGEEAEMCKEEPDFRGRDFEKQYACRFKSDSKIDMGAFGKVLVEKSKNTGRNDLIFEFNLYKSGNETEMNTGNNGERWTIVAIKELAANLEITEESNWQRFAQSIGFTKNEIRTKLVPSGDPFVAMTNLYQLRGGTPDEFVQALFAVSRDIGLKKFNETPPTSSAGSSPCNSASGYLNKQLSPMSKFFNFWNRKENDQEKPNVEESPEDEDADSEMRPPPSRHRASSSQKRSHPSSGKNSSKRSSKKEPPPKRQRHVSPAPRSEESSSGSISSDEDDGHHSYTSAGRTATSVKSSSKNHRISQKILTTNNLWKITEVLSASKWKTFARDLGLDESSVTSIEVEHKGQGTRELAYQVLLEWKNIKAKNATLGVLYKCLERAKMKQDAKHMMTLFESD
ncbi:uncharacterized protein LOC132197884 [Neocloeon triangulifer]|uniref:uncharacterized protein LOC132197884 n=1 Tax=Neocloeon triangulifer TaxID=2078957 RepID=UPI00286EC92F|nr:uncharacterized protein LOC132197884 [Neocloeon triangulifer]